MKSIAAETQVAIAAWSTCSQELRALRHEVFVVGQHVPAALEDDGLDPACVHVVARDAQGRVVGTGRLMPDGRIGRIAVRAQHRGQGIGTVMLRVLIDAARERGAREVHLHAQAHAREFYARFGFVADGEPFDEAGIAHVSMRASIWPPEFMAVRERHDG